MMNPVFQNSHCFNTFTKLSGINGTPQTMPRKPLAQNFLIDQTDFMWMKPTAELSDRNDCNTCYIGVK